jgi:hypothetical protein
MNELSVADTLGTGEGAVQMDKRRRASKYKTLDYHRASPFRFIRFRRRALAGMTTKSGINMFTVKYKKGARSYYLTTRSVPATATSFKHPAGHSEPRFGRLQPQFLKRHKLAAKHFQWAATEREPCGVGAGMANCRQTVATLGMPADRIFFGFPYPDREDVRAHAHQTPSELNPIASRLRSRHNQDMDAAVRRLATHADSDSESEDDDHVVDEYESDYGEDSAKRRKHKGLKGAFREGRDDT